MERDLRYRAWKTGPHRPSFDLLRKKSKASPRACAVTFEFLLLGLDSMNPNIRCHETPDHLVAFTIFQGSFYDLLGLKGPALGPEG